MNIHQLTQITNRPQLTSLTLTLKHAKIQQTHRVQRWIALNRAQQKVQRETAHHCRTQGLA